MSIKSPRDIYHVLEKHLRTAAAPGGGGPMTVTMLMDIPEVRQAALNEFTSDDDVRIATNRLSDALGFMWRRGLLTRYPAPKESNSFARYSYIWDQQEDIRPVTEKPLAYTSSGKLGCAITEIDDGVVLDFVKFTITIKGKT